MRMVSLDSPNTWLSLKAFKLFFINSSLDNEDGYDERVGSGSGNGNNSLRPLSSNPFLQVGRLFQLKIA